jgi:hypothetical protein
VAVLWRSQPVVATDVPSGRAGKRTNFHQVFRAILRPRALLPRIRPPKRLKLSQNLIARPWLAAGRNPDFSRYARWQIDARLGHKQAVIDMLGVWARDIAPQIGWTADKGRMLTGSIDARQATVVHERAVGDLAELEKSWAALGELDAHKTWGTQMEPYVVSGSSRWEVFRIV